MTNLSSLSPGFLEAVRLYVEKDLNYEYSWSSRQMVRKRDRGHSGGELSAKELPFVTVTKVLDFEDFTYYGGYCETCSYTETHCNVVYETEDGKRHTFEYDGTFLGMLDSLVSADAELE